MIQPLRDGVVVVPEQAEKVTQGGIVLASVHKAQYLKGKVIAVGSGRINDDGTINEMEVRVGDRVVFAEGAGVKIGEDNNLLLREFEILAVAVDGESFPLKPLKDIVFILPDSMPEKVGSFFIPESVREKYKDSTGTVLAVGKGCYVQKFKKYIPTMVKVGDRVLYDYQIPFSMEVKTPEGTRYQAAYMGEKDLQGIIRG